MAAKKKQYLKDAVSIARAIVANQAARYSPSLYIRWTQDTGRGEIEEDAEKIALYFKQCFHDYVKQLNIKESETIRYFRDLRILEYGPGDILGVALLLHAYGAETVHCVDRFPLKQISDKYVQVYSLLLDSLNGEQRERGMNAFSEKGRPESGFRQGIIDYTVTRRGLSGRYNEYDLIISRAVLEHVSNIDKTFHDISHALKPGGISIHKVDLRSHGLDRWNTLDFLNWPELLYKLMHSHKGFPNRYRIDRYRESLKRSGLQVIKLEPTEILDYEKIRLVHPHMAKPFRRLSYEDLSWMGFWMTIKHSKES